MRFPPLAFFVFASLLFGLPAGALPPADPRSAEARRVLSLLNVVGEEYREGVENGRVVQPLEYEEAKVFLAEAAERSGALAPLTSGDFAALRAKIDNLVSLAEVDQAISRLREQITTATGVADEVFPEQPPSAARGRVLYQQNCISCHGEAADGKGPNAGGLQPPPANFSDPAFIRFETPYDFFHIMGVGKGSSAMPAWDEVLSLQDRWDLVAHLWTVQPGHAGLATGQGIYLSHCAGCHGASGDGAGAYSATLLKPVPNLSSPAALARKTDEDMFQTVTKGIPGTPMPAFRRTLSDDERWAAAVFLRQLSLGGVQSLREPEPVLTQSPQRFVGLLRLVGREYALAFPEGAEPNLLERAESRLLVEQIEYQTAALLKSFSVDPKFDAERLRSELQRLVGAVREDQPVTVVTTLVNEIAAQVESYVPAAAGSEESSSPASGLAETRRLLAEALAAYGRSDPSALYRVSDAYFQFEPVERPLTLKAPELTREIEERFLELRGALGRAGNETAASRIVAEIEQRLDGVALALKPAGSGQYSVFVQAMIIILREGFEVVLLVGALLAYVARSGHGEMKRQVWAGAGIGIVVSLITAFFLNRILRTTATGAAVEAIEGVTMLLAAVVLFWVSYWLISKAEAERWQRFIQGKVKAALSRGSRIALVGTAFLAVYREGVETVLFYQALASSSDGQLSSVVSGIATGSILLAILSVLFIRFGMRVPIRPFFLGTSILLYTLAVSFAGRGVAELQEGGWIPVTSVPWMPRIDLLGIFPTAETLAAQGAFIALLLYAVVVLLRRRPAPAAAPEPNGSTRPAL